MNKAFVLFSTASISAIILILFVFFSLNDGKLHLVVCDVGQGDAIFIRTASGSDILVDGGPGKSVLSCLNRHMPFWDRNLEAIILTHPDADHITGMVSVLKSYKVDALYTQPNPGTTDIYELFRHELAAKKLSATYVSAGDRLNLTDGASLNIIWPDSKQPEKIGHNGSKTSLPAGRQGLNRFSVTTIVKYGNFKALLTGDAGIEVGDRIASSVGDIDVLKVPHHGSKTGMSDYYLSTIKPELAVISVGAKNSYGHPAPFSLNLLKKHGVKTLRTDQDGEIEILSDGSTWSVKTSRN